MTTTPAIRRLIGTYVMLSMLTVVALAVLAGADPGQATPEAWVRGVIVAGTSMLTLLFATRAAKGDARAALRLRIIVAVLLVAFTAVLFFLPLPAWMVGEQAACAVLLLATAVLIFRRPQTR